MNLFFSLLFFFLFYWQCRLAGSVVCILWGSESSHRWKLILGYFTTFFLLFFPGFIAQVLHLSSAAYGWLSFFVLLGADAGFLWYSRKHDLTWEKADWKTFLSRYWFVIVYVGIFTYFCMASQLGIVNGGYDDTYYISKVVNNMGAPHMGVEGYFYGNVISDSLSLERIFNTYELAYGLFAGWLHIYPAYFCRVTMTVINNTLFALAVMEFAGLFVRKEDLLQYALAPMVIFLIPFAILSMGTIHSYDSWQMTTAMFYGGSVVRTTMLFVVICAAMPCMKKMSWRPVLVCAGLYLTCLSFSSIAITDGAALLLVLGMSKLCHEAVCSKGWRKKAMYITFIVVVLLFLCLAAKVLYGWMQGTPAMEQMQLHKDVWFPSDVLVNYGWVPMLGCFVLDTRGDGKNAAWISLGLWGLTCSFKFMGLMMALSFMYFFVYMRLIASVQLLAAVFWAILVLVVLERFLYKVKILAAAAAIAITGSVLGQFVTKSDSWQAYDQLGSGISAAGWDWGRPFDITTPMVADAVFELGQYYDSLPYGNYVTGVPLTIPSNGEGVNSKNLLTASNRVELAGEEAEPFLSTYLSDHAGSYEDIMDLVRQYGISYLLSANEETTSELSSSGWQPVVTGSGWTLFENPES